MHTSSVASASFRSLMTTARSAWYPAVTAPSSMCLRARARKVLMSVRKGCLLAGVALAMADSFQVGQLSQRGIQQHHHDEAADEPEGGGLLMALAMGLGNDLVRHHPQHRAGGETQPRP